MAVLSKLLVELGLDPGKFDAGLSEAKGRLSGFDDAVRSSEKTTGRFGETFKGVLGGMLAASVISGGFGEVKDQIGEAIKAGEEMQQTQLKTNAIFGAGAEDVTKWAEGAATGLGMSDGEAQKTADTFGNLFKNIGFTTDSLPGMTENMTNVVAQVAAFNNADPSDVLNAIDKGVVGSTKGLKQFGIVISQADIAQEALNETGKTSAKDLTTQEKTQAAYNLIMAKTANLNGTVAARANTLAGASRILHAQLENLREEIGLKLIPIMTFLTITASKALTVFMNILLKGVLPLGGYIISKLIPIFKLLIAPVKLFATTILESVRSAIALFTFFRSKGVDPLSAAVQALGLFFQDLGLSGIGNFFANLGDSVASAEAEFEFLKKQGLDPLSAAIGAISLLFADMGLPGVGAAFATVADAVLGMAHAVGYAFDGTKSFTDLLTRVPDWLKPITLGLLDIVSGLGKLVKGLENNGIAGFVAAFSDGWRQISNGFGILLSGIGGAIVNAIPVIAEAFVNVMAGIDWAGIAKAGWGLLKAAFLLEVKAALIIPKIELSIAEWALGSIPDVWSWLTSHVFGAKPEGDGTSMQMTQGFTLTSVLVNIASWLPGAIVDFGTWLWGYIHDTGVWLISTTINIASWAAGKIADLGTFLWGYVHDAGVWLVSVIVNVSNWAAGVIPDVATWLTNFVGGVGITLFSVLVSITNWTFDSSFGPSIGSAIVTAIQGIVDLGAQIGGAVADQIKSINWGAVITADSFKVGEAFGGGIHDALVRYGPDIVTKAADALTSVDWVGVMQGVANGIQTAKDAAPAALAAIAVAIASFIGGALVGLVFGKDADFGSIVTKITTALSDALTAGEDAIGAIGTGIIQGIETGWTTESATLQSYASGLPSWVLAQITDAPTALSSVGSGLIQGVETAWTDESKTLQSYASGLTAWVLGLITDAPTALLQVGHDLIGGVETGWTDESQNLQNYATGLGTWVAGKVGDLSRTLWDAGDNLILGLGKGISDELGNSIIRWAQGLGGWIIDEVGDLSNALWGAGSAVIGGLWAGMQSKWNDVANWLSGLAIKIPGLKGPPAKDAAILTNNGRLVMHGFGVGLAQGWNNVARQLSSYTPQIPGAMSASVPAFAGGSMAGVAAAGGSGGGGNSYSFGDIVINGANKDGKQLANEIMGHVDQAVRRKLGG